MGTLYIVATPIGNLRDMVPRALDLLQRVDLIAAEDTRRTQQLLSHFDLQRPLVAYHDHNEEAVTARLVEQLRQGSDIALVSDAGTPLVSDPGYRLVRAAQDAGITVVPIPGPVAAMVALSAAGLPSDRFSFEGFLPAKSGARRSQLQALKDDPRTLIFYEAPHRIVDTLKDLVDLFGAEREAAIARELTKTFETIKRAPLASLLDWVESDSNQQRGEIVLLVRGADGEVSDVQALSVARILAEELPTKQAAKLAARLTGANRRDLYQALLDSRPVDD